MNLLKRSPPPSQTHQSSSAPPQPHTVQPPQPSVPPPTALVQPPSVSSVSNVMGGENSAFRTVATAALRAEDLHQHIRNNTTIATTHGITATTPIEQPRRPSAFRMISQLVGEESPKSKRPRSISRSESEDNHDDPDDDEEIEVQDDCETDRSWRDRWIDQQPLELTKHDR